MQKIIHQTLLKKWFLKGIWEWIGIRGADELGKKIVKLWPAL